MRNVMTVTSAKQAFTVRPYRPHTDHPAVVDICKPVYGGTDALPRQLPAQAAEPGTRVWVAERGGGAVDALVCSQQRGDVVWVWGARTREEARRRGLARALLEHVEAHSLTAGTAARWLLSTTIPANTTMLRMFGRLGYRVQCEVDVWPGWQVLREVVRLSQQLPHAEGLAPAPGGGGMHEPPRLLSLLPGLADTLHGAGAAELLPLWQACSTADQALTVHLQLRSHRGAAAARQQAHSSSTDEAPACSSSGSGGCGSGSSTCRATGPFEEHATGAAAGAFAWLPLDYNLLPLGGEQLEGMLQAGSIWMLGLPRGCQGAAQGQLDAGILTFSYCSYHSHWYAGIVAGSEAALASAVLKALELQPGCARFYVDRCERFALPGFLAAAASAAEGSEGPSSYLVLHKRLR